MEVIMERLVDKVGIENLTPKHFYELLEPVLDKGEYWIDFGQDEDGNDFLVFDGWKVVSYVQGLINGFEGLGNDPMLFGENTFESEIVKLTKELIDLDPEKSWQKRSIEQRIRNCQSWIDYKTYLKDNDLTEVSFDDFGIEWGFSDEYSRCACGNCSNIVRIAPDSYSWTSPLFVDGEGYISDECVADGSFDDYILEEYANKQKSIPEARHPDDLELTQINKESLENGWYGGQNDTPEPIIEALNAHDIDVWFVVHPSQFMLDFDVYVRDEDFDLAKAVFEGTNTKLDYDPAVKLEKALSNVKI
jgi:hypothetical protein